MNIHIGDVERLYERARYDQNSICLGKFGSCAGYFALRGGTAE